MYEIRFRQKLEKASVETELSEGSLSAIQTMNSAAIVFDELKNCLFLNTAAEEILGDKSNIILLENWIRSLKNNSALESGSFSATEIPLLLNSISDCELKQLEILIDKIDISEAFWTKFDNKIQEIQQLYQVDGQLSKTNLIDQRLIHKKLLDTVFCDRLTGLPNHDLFLRRIERYLNFISQNRTCKFAILFLDINRFKVINSSLGRILGDRLLISISQRLQTCLRSQDFIARIGSDEFAILLSNINHLDYATNIAERIYREFLVPFNLDGYEVFVEACIGIAVGTEDYRQAEDLLRDAELAVSDAKRQAKCNYQVFDRTMHGRAMTRLQLENDLRKAIKNQEFILHYQPIVSLADNRIKGFEVLVRWQHSTRGLVSPMEFISLAEETGLIVSLGSWVLREACRQMRIWQLQFGDIVTWKTSVNISSKQLSQPDFVQQVKQILQETELSPHNLKLEITESCLVEDTKTTINILKELKAIGIEFSLDDFGTGYSSLSYLHQFPFDTLKIDRSFVKSIENNSEKLGIVRAIVALARNLGMDTIAEGIETVTQLAQLKALKCQYGQGYFLFKPLDKIILETTIAVELARTDEVHSENYRAILEEQVAREQLLFHIEHLRQELEEIKLEKADLEIMLETTTEHADLVESQLHREIIERQKAQAALREVNQELEKLSVLDSLTQIANRRRFDDFLLEKWQQLRQEQAFISLILCDIDYFKLYNDHYGHPIGDYCLQQVALALEAVVDSTPGLLARYGGEEFGIILPNTNGTQALKIAEEIALKVNRLHIAHQKSPINEYVTISLGVFSVIPSSQTTPELLIALADKALYEAKAGGRNRACLLTE